MAMRDHDLNEQDKETMEKFLDYLSKETTWRYTLRDWNRLETVIVWDKSQVNGCMIGLFIGNLVDLLKLPLEDLVSKCVTAYSKGWEMQVMYYRFKEGE
jgi:hypothetical protein